MLSTCLEEELLAKAPKQVRKTQFVSNIADVNVIDPRSQSAGYSSRSTQDDTSFSSKYQGDVTVSLLRYQTTNITF